MYLCLSTVPLWFLKHVTLLNTNPGFDEIALGEATVWVYPKAQNPLLVMIDDRIRSIADPTSLGRAKGSALLPLLGKEDNRDSIKCSWTYFSFFIIFKLD